MREGGHAEGLRGLRICAAEEDRPDWREACPPIDFSNFALPQFSAQHLQKYVGRKKYQERVSTDADPKGGENVFAVVRSVSPIASLLWTELRAPRSTRPFRLLIHGTDPAEREECGIFHELRLLRHSWLGPDRRPLIRGLLFLALAWVSPFRVVALVNLRLFLHRIPSGTVRIKSMSLYRVDIPHTPHPVGRALHTLFERSNAACARWLS